MKRFFESPWGRFLIKSVTIFGVWFVLYDLWLLPDGRVDRWVSLFIVDMNARLLSALGYEFWVVDRAIGLVGSNGVLLVDGCNGLEVLGLFMGFVVAYPGSWRDRAWFIPAGISLIFVVNIFRILTLLLLQSFKPDWFDFLHDILISSIFYMMVFVLWMGWAWLSERSGGPSREGDQSGGAGRGLGSDSPDATSTAVPDPA